MRQVRGIDRGANGAPPKAPRGRPPIMRTKGRDLPAIEEAPVDIVLPKSATVVIRPPNLQVLAITITGTAPLMINKFSNKALLAMREKQAAGSTATKGRRRDPKDFEAAFHEARHISTEGWDGFPASGFRSAMISACRLVGYKMTLAKLSLFIVADGLDRTEGTPLVRIQGGQPEKTEMAARNETGVVDIRVRPMWRKWKIDLKIRYDADQFTPTDVVNLLARVGAQVGIGEGRPDSKNSAGIGFGTFAVETEQ